MRSMLLAGVGVSVFINSCTGRTLSSQVMQAAVADTITCTVTHRSAEEPETTEGVAMTPPAAIALERLLDEATLKLRYDRSTETAYLSVFSHRVQQGAEASGSLAAGQSLDLRLVNDGESGGTDVEARCVRSGVPAKTASSQSVECLTRDAEGREESVRASLDGGSNSLGFPVIAEAQALPDGRLLVWPLADAPRSALAVAYATRERPLQVPAVGRLLSCWMP